MTQDGGINNFSASRRRTAWTFCAGLLLLVVLLATYADSFHAFWHYDDYANIVNNPKIHIAKLSWSNIGNSLAAGLHDQIIGRPLAYLSFAVNYRFGGLDVFGYHLVNFAIHWLASVFLFLFIRNMLRLPALNPRHGQHADAVALIAALLWAVHPIQVTAVTYVVQRMASMAGLFYIMTMYLYLKGRLAVRTSDSILFFGLCVFTGVCALLTKENTPVLIYALWLFDFFLIQGINRETFRKNLIIFLGLTAFMILVGFLYVNPADLFQPFTQRSFTRLERLLTEPRVLFFYLFLIVTPMTSHMAIAHDIQISHSLFTPWTTTLSIAGVLAMVLGLILLARKNPLLSFCGLFFFLNHVVEGSFLNLELVYEHRNYIPTMLLFVPVGLAVVTGLHFFNYRRSLQGLIIGCLMALVVSQGCTTFKYNRLFSSELDTWSHVVVTYPQFSLGYLNLGRIYWDAGHFQKANAAFHKALEKNRYNNSYQKAMVYYNLGMYEALKVNDNATASGYFQKAAAIYPDPVILNGMAVNYLKLADYRAAVKTADIILKKIPEDSNALMIKAQGLRSLDDKVDAAGILENLRKKYAYKNIVALALIEIYAEMQEKDAADRVIGELLEHNGGKGLTAGALSIERPELSSYVPNASLLERMINSYIRAKNAQQ